MDDIDLIRTLIAGIDALTHDMVIVSARHREAWDAACEAADRWKDEQATR